MTPRNEHITPPHSEDNHSKMTNNPNPIFQNEPEADPPLPLTEHPATEIEISSEPQPLVSPYEEVPLPEVENTDDWGGGVKAKKGKKKGRAPVYGFAD